MRVPETHWLARLIRDPVSEEARGVLEDDPQGCLLASKCMHTYTNPHTTLLHLNTQRHTHLKNGLI